MIQRRRWMAVGVLGRMALWAASTPVVLAAPQANTVEPPAESAPARAAHASIAHVRIAGSLPEGVGQEGLLADVSPHLHRLVERLDKAAGDARIKGVLLSIDSPSLGRGRTEELRAAIKRLRRAGKTVAAHLVSGSPAHYAVACACDTVSMPPASTLEITGVRAEMMFFKSLLDRLGVAAEILQVGEFKGAAEPLMRDSMSPQLRAQYEAFVGDLYDQFVEQVASDRHMAEERIRELVDVGVFSAEAAREAGLIDAVGYEDEAAATLASRLGAAAPKLTRDYAERKFDGDFSGIGGLVKMMELFSSRGKSSTAGRGKRLAIVHVAGEIREGKSADELLMGGSAGSETVCKAIRDAAKDDQVVAIVLRIDSPGGSALASDLIWREADRTTKPVVASLSDIAASGGYYIAVAADRIVAAPGTLTGSIGVVGGKVAIGDALDRLGVHTDVVSKGRHADWMSIQKPFTSGEREAFLGTMKEIYRLFTSKVASGRRLDPSTVEELAAGRVFTGRQALANGLVDRLGTLDDAIDEARTLAGIDADEEVDQLLLPEPRGILDDLLASSERGMGPAAWLAASSGDATVRRVIMTRMAGVPGLDAFLAEADTLTHLLSGRPQFLMPLRVQVR